jgi:hypothetical protein
VTLPSGDAMTVRFHRDAEIAALKRQKLRRPVAWQVHPDDAARFAVERKHCEGRRGTRRCQDPIAIVTWRWYRSAEAGRVLAVERFLCDEHGQEFAGRHHIEIDPPPDVPSRSHGKRMREPEPLPEPEPRWR